MDTRNIITAKELRIGDEFLYLAYAECQEPIALFVFAVNQANDAIGDWYDYEKADTLDTASGDAIIIHATSLDGSETHYLSLTPSEPIALLN